MTGKNSIELAIGPMSPETVEATFRYSHFHRVPLMLIASKSQVDYAGGYVNGWTTKTYMDFVGEMRTTYNNAQVKICRDHCGPGFNGNYDLADTYATIDEDIRQGFDLIHIDYCHFKGPRDEQRAETKKAIEHCLAQKPTVQIEIGTDENTGANYSLPNLAEWEKEIDFFKSFCTPEFYVVQTGSLVKEINQAGTFNAAFVEQVSKMLKTKNLKLKEHNADYLPKDDIAARRGIVDAQNIAPQLGVVQTQTVLTKCLIYGIPIDEFVRTVHDGGKWKKWMHTNTADNILLTVAIAGHYHFTSPAYKKIIDELAKREDIKETIIERLTEVISHYVEG
ncbi:hypothetical protein EXS62_02935 [Candidatus Kaiserbacteria bacterium]|nr:hypothetical protein [Candidatus Kaiserbacteria bacterium]